ncbi:MAG: alpha/beta hydrolase [Geodermatophilaceae bacterium]|nr:alpha/beta hydrolase [Geodermatophilaceae bacterium]
MPDATTALIAGPWTHRDYAVNGVRLHVAEAGQGPLVLLVHGFPGFWWSWRHQIPVLAQAGFRVMAPDLRGYGASDKPPRGYDAVTASADLAGLIRTAGERDAVVVGHDWGGLLSWSVAALHPRVVQRLVVLSMPHPRRLRTAPLRVGGQLRPLGPLLGAQLPRLPESRLTRDDGALVARLLRARIAPGWPAEDLRAAEERYAEAICIPQAAYGALEYARWAIRSLPRGDGRRWARAMATPIDAATLHLQGGADPYLLPASADGSGRYVAGDYDFRLLPGVGHHPHEERPAEITALITDWARG